MTGQGEDEILGHTVIEIAEAFARQFPDEEADYANESYPSCDGETYDRAGT
jgi:hypothetical protein